MTKKKSRTSGGDRTFWDLTLDGWLRNMSAGGETADADNADRYTQTYDGKNDDHKKESGHCGRMILAGGFGETRNRAIAKAVGDRLPAWQKNWLERRQNEVLLFAESETPIWVLRPKSPKSSGKRPEKSSEKTSEKTPETEEKTDALRPSHHGLFAASEYHQARNLAGSIVPALVDAGISELSIECLNASHSQVLGTLVGLELGGYKYTRARGPYPEGKLPRLTFSLSGSAGEVAAVREMAATLGTSVNIARHLVNIPAGELHPESYASSVAGLFAGSKTTKVEIWDEERLRREKANLLLAVGQGAVNGARLVHIKYRPAGKARLARPLAFVGKGVTFDTGGLDIKPSSAMRLMKKDMGGSAALVGLAWYLEHSGVDVPCDIWLALAENAVDQKSFRPGDVITARNGLRVEIHNTDAEGRLVMADAMDVAVTREGTDAPLALIDVSTLTGAMRVALGTTIGGILANDDRLADEFVKLGQIWGDPLWRMPLFEDYKSTLRSTFADIANASDSPFGGPITAALFLQRFTKSVPWVHFDVFAWADKISGGLNEIGGNGQPVQALVGFVEACQPSWFAGGHKR